MLIWIEDIRSGEKWTRVKAMRDVELTGLGDSLRVECR